MGLDIKSYSPKSKPVWQQERDSETIKAEQGETSRVGKIYLAPLKIYLAPP